MLLPEQTDEAAERRKASRQRIREEIAARSVAVERRDAMTEELQRLEDLASEAADDHAEKCAPLQQELASLEKAAITRIANREPVVPDEDARRATLAMQIEHLNSELRAKCDGIEKLKGPVIQAREKLSVDIAKLPTEMNLFRWGAAEPEWMQRRFAIEWVRGYMSNAGSGAEKAIMQARHNDSVAPLDNGSSREDRWEAVRSLLREISAYINDEDRRLQQKMREE